MRVVIAPDSYKGSLTAVQVAEIMASAVECEIPSAQIIKIPMADGGEGTVDALSTALNGEIKAIRVHGPLDEEIESYFGCSGKTAILEAANIVGLPMVPSDLRNPLNTSSRGLGEAFITVLNHGYRDLIIGIGGSSTNDGGMGFLSALGAKFTDSNGHRLIGFGRDVFDVSHVDFSGLDPRVSECRITVACDVTNPLLGFEGASFVYGPQKGASPELCEKLDDAMARYAGLVEASLGAHRNQPGAGAAGGLGFALLSIGADLVPGARVVEELTGLKDWIRGADWVLTGEGRSDVQTLFGKLPLYVADIAREAGTEAVLISGSLGPGSEQLLPKFSACFSIVDRPASLEECMTGADTLLHQTTRNVMRLIARAQGLNK
jgi:glycerate 2-kinase